MYHFVTLNIKALHCSPWQLPPFNFIRQLKKNSAENNNILECDRSDVVISILAPPTRQKYRRAEEAYPTDKTMICLHRRREWEEEKREK